MQDLAPPDSVVRPTKPAGAASNSSCDVQQQGSSGKAAAAAEVAVRGPAGIDKAPAGKASKGGEARKQKGSKVAPESERNAELEQAANSKAKAAKVAFDTGEADAEQRGIAKVQGKEAKAAAVAERGESEVEPRAAAMRKGKAAKAASQEARKAPKKGRVVADAQAKGPAEPASEIARAATDIETKILPVAAGAAAERPHRKRGSKQPYWLAQVCPLKILHAA